MRDEFDEVETIDRNPKSWVAWKREAERLQGIIDGMALAAMDSEPVAEVYQVPNVGICAALGPSIRMLCALEPGTKLYRHAQPATDGEQLAIENFRSAMEGIGHIRRTLEETFGGLHGTHVEPDVLAECKAICDAIYAAYGHEQPVPVVPDELLSMAASAIEDLLEHTDPNTSYYSGVWADVPGKLRAAMIAAAPQDEAKKDKPHNNFGTGARLTNHRFKV
ncbi:hypothetical protein [Raoultella planticola]|uniref:hypothetical protein n=1 Tax=Raoultella planticola TaxID=575 RepID=UPI001BD5379B|nr:hypothetical protein [Raoultella planticola]